ncbi:MAG: hypothetical protein IPJ77_05015 [Planctomycetes bacterium]|nr:hypothetical protein [Planctomycetota bacterium]
MADPRPEFPTPEELEERFRILGQLYDLGIALREIRFLDPQEERMRRLQLDRVNDVRQRTSAESNEHERPDSNANAHPTS